MDRPTVCSYNKFGFCKYGVTCRKKHEERKCEKSSCEIFNCHQRHPKECRFFREFQRCKYNEYCRYEHKENSEVNKSVKSNDELETRVSDLENDLENTDKFVKMLEVKLYEKNERIQDLENKLNKLISASSVETTNTPENMCSSISVSNTPICLQTKETDNAESDCIEEVFTIDVSKTSPKNLSECPAPTNNVMPFDFKEVNNNLKLENSKTEIDKADCSEEYSESNSLQSECEETIHRKLAGDLPFEPRIKKVSWVIVPMTSEDSDSDSEDLIEVESSKPISSFDFNKEESSFSMFQNLIKFWNKSTEPDVNVETSNDSEDTTDEDEDTSSKT